MKFNELMGNVVLSSPKICIFFTSELEQKNVPPKVWFFSDQIAMKDSSFMMECIAYGR